MTADAQGELLDVLDEQGRHTGQRRHRASCHLLGLPHAAVHVWLCNARDELLLQLRSRNKIAFPLCWDISAAGHVPAGETPQITAVRELAEELGVTQLQPQPLWHFSSRFTTNNGNFVEHEHVTVFGVFIADPEALHLSLQQSEVEAVKWISRTDFFERLERRDDPTLVNIANATIRHELCSRLDAFRSAHIAAMHK